MTGDGVNDVLALKDADIGVSMGSGSPATRAVAQIVLLDNKFATLPYVVGEGRRVIGNIERVSNLFLTKTVYSVLLAFLIGITGVLSQIFHFEPVPYPFLPRHVTIAAWFTIGIPAFILSLAPNNERARSGFVPRVMRLAVPSGGDHRCHDVHFVSPRLRRPGSDGDAEDPGGHVGTDHPHHDRAVGAGRGRAAVRVVEAGADLRIRSGISHPVRVAVHAGVLQTRSDERRRTTSALVCGLVGVVFVEIGWWVTGRLHGEHRRLFAVPEDLPGVH